MQVTSLLQRLEKTLPAESDHALIERFLADNDPAAFRVIVSRHGPMVYRVCRRLLHNEADAEDAFQAAFLVLLRKARGIRKRTSLAAWLHGVARQASLRLRTTASRRQAREARASRAEAVPAADAGASELRDIVDEELIRLPERLRSPLVLCLLEGLTQAEAAAHLGMARRTFQRYLESGRTLLGIRLTQRGITLSAGLLAALASESLAAMPGGLADETSSLVSAVVGGEALASRSQTLNALSHEVIRHMFTTRPGWKWLAMALLGIGLGAAAIGPRMAIGQPPLAGADVKPPTPPALAPDKAGERANPGNGIAWGKTVDGLKAGIGFRCSEEQSCRVGGSATLVVYLRNESRAPITVTYDESLLDERVPHVRDGDGKSVPVYQGTIFLGHVLKVPRTLEPGQTIRLDYAWFLVRSTTWKGKVESPTLAARPGRYAVACMDIPLQLKGREDMKWSTGWVELTVEAEGPAWIPNKVAKDENDPGDKRFIEQYYKQLYDTGNSKEAAAKVETLIRSRLGLRLTVAEPARIKVNEPLRGGLIVMDVDSGSAAARAGVRKGDVLVGLQKWETLSLDNVVFVLAQSESSSQLVFYIIRDGQVHKGAAEVESDAVASAAVEEAETSLRAFQAEMDVLQAAVLRLRGQAVLKADDQKLLKQLESQLTAAKAVRDEAQSKLYALKLEVQQSKTALRSAQSKAERWQKEVDEDRQLVKKGVLDHQALAEAEFKLKEAKAEWDAAKARLDALQGSRPKPSPTGPAPKLPVETESTASRLAAIEAQAALKSAEAQVERWQSEVERLHKLASQKVVDQQVVAESERQLSVAKAMRDVAKAKLDAMLNPQAEVEAAQASLRLAELQVERWQHEVDVDRDLVNKSVLDKQTLTEAEYKLKEARALRDAAKAKLDACQGSLPKIVPDVPSHFPPPKSGTTAPPQIDQPNPAPSEQDQIEVAKASVELAEAEYLHRKHLVERTRELVNKGMLDKNTLEEAEDRLRIAAAGLDLAKAKLKALPPRSGPTRP